MTTSYIILLTGTPSNCSECHECYFQWYWTLENISSVLEALLDRVELLIQQNYEGITVERIRMDVQELLDLLAGIRAILQSIQSSLRSSPTNNLTGLLNEVCLNYCGEMTTCKHYIAFALS